MTTATVTVRNSTYAVAFESDEGEQRPTLRNSRGQFAGFVFTFCNGVSLVMGAPKNWNDSENRKAARAALIALEQAA